MRVLATGGAGFVGSHTVRALRRAGHEVTIVDSLVRGHRSFVERLGVPLVELDIRDEKKLHELLARGWDAVVHFAALALVPESVQKPNEYWDMNFRAGLILLDGMRHAGIKKLVVSSTAAVYGDSQLPLIPEDTVLSPLNPYGASKLSFELALVRESVATGLRFFALRYFNAVGASDEGDLGEDHDPETHLIPLLLRAAKAKKPFSVFGTDHATPDGTCVRDFVHVEDLARAHVLALEKLDGTSGAVNLGTGRGHSVLEVVAAAEEVLGRKIETEPRPRRAGDPPRLVADASRAERLLGFKTQRTLADAIRSQERFLSR